MTCQYTDQQASSIKTYRVCLLVRGYLSAKNLRIKVFSFSSLSSNSKRVQIFSLYASVLKRNLHIKRWLLIFYFFYMQDICVPDNSIVQYSSICELNFFLKTCRAPKSPYMFKDYPTYQPSFVYMKT